MTLSELVAVEVMGWHEIVGGWGRWYESDGSHAVLDNDWFPDTSMDDAMYWVVKHMRAKGWRFALEDRGDNNHMAEFWREPDHPEYKETDGWQDFQLHGNEPLAICLAALRACGVSDDRIEQARRKHGT